MASHSSTWTIESLRALRHVSDPLADKAAEAIVHSANLGELHRILRKLATNDQAIPAGLPKEVADFFEESGKLDLTPEAINKLDIASGIFRQYGPMIVFALLFRSLPITYMANKPAHVLIITRLLEDFPERRIIETAQFVFDVMAEGWYKPGMRGIRTAQKVRLMHAGIRHLLSHENQDQWDPEWGLPISQEDMLATLQTFSLEVLKGLDRMGIHLSDEEEDAWFFAWTRIGTIMGIRPDIMPATRKEAERFQKLIYAHLFTEPVVPSDPGPKLIKALIGFLENVTDSPLFRNNVLVLMRFLINNDHWCTVHLKLPIKRKDSFFIWIVKILMHIFQFLTKVTGGENGFVTKLTHHLLLRIYNAKRGGKEAPFEVPASLEEEFNLERKLAGS